MSEQAAEQMGRWANGLCMSQCGGCCVPEAVWLDAIVVIRVAAMALGGNGKELLR
jgi:hypothetical protein